MVVNISIEYPFHKALVFSSAVKMQNQPTFFFLRPVVNTDVDPKDELIKELQVEITNLRQKLRE